MIVATESDFDVFFKERNGFDPYPYQSSLGNEGLPEILEAETGTGKTEAIVAAWLWRRQFHPKESVRKETPRWLIYALPMRTLVEQTVERIESMVKDLETPVEVHRVMGGIDWDDRSWRQAPGTSHLFVGTIDMLLSRALNRGYGDSRFSWPISFGMFNNDCHWVFDEIQLMGVAVPTSRQLQAFRETIGTIRPTHTTWMSATIDRQTLETVDNPFDDASKVSIGPGDIQGELQTRLEAAKRPEEVELPDKGRSKTLAKLLVERHEPDSLTIAIVNTVDSATELHRELEKLKPGTAIHLLHSRFRPLDRAAANEAAIGSDDLDADRIVVATQVLEAGVDLSAKLLYTDAAPWSSIIQRAGRCNRKGTFDDATVLWSPPAKPLPYEATDIDAAIEVLRSLEGQQITPRSMSAIKVETVPPVLPILRRRDLIDLFDTTPDMSGNDIDVARFIRDPDSRSVSVAWREFTTDANEVSEEFTIRPHRDELCSVPIAEFRTFVKKLDDRSAAWRLDHLTKNGQGGWVRLQASDIRDGLIVVLRSNVGGYTAAGGWNRSSKATVPPVNLEAKPADAAHSDDMGAADDNLSCGAGWITLEQHLHDVAHEARQISEQIGLTDQSLIDAVVTAGRLHDIGKAHPTWQEAIRNTIKPEADDAETQMVNDESKVWAKSGNRGRLRFSQPYFRHELASLIALMGEGAVALKNSDEPDLIRYLVAAHHGRIRLAIRRLPNEAAGRSDLVLGVIDQSKMPAVKIPGLQDLPAHALNLIDALQGTETSRSYGERVLGLRERKELGIFRLAMLEAIVRLADWRASAADYPHVDLPSTKAGLA